jgi:hypothetical protein
MVQNIFATLVGAFLRANEILQKSYSYMLTFTRMKKVMFFCTGFTRLHGDPMGLGENMGMALSWVDVMGVMCRYTMQPRCWLVKKGCWPIRTNTLALSELWISILIR